VDKEEQEFSYNMGLKGPTSQSSQSMFVRRAPAFTPKGKGKSIGFGL
jgi:hypothetical protein